MAGGTGTRPGIRILHCHSTFDLGGKEARAVRLMNAFGPRARHTILSAMPDALGARRAIDPGIQVEFPHDHLAPALHGKPAPGRYLALGRYMQNFDLVLSYNWGSMDAVMAHRVCSAIMPLPPLIHHEDGFNEDETVKRNWKRNLFRRHGLPTARTVVVPSHVLEGIARDEWGVGKRLHRISNGIPTAQYRNKPVADAIPGFTRQPGDVVVGTVAGLRRVKNLTALVDALTHTPKNVRLVIVGEGPERHALEYMRHEFRVADRVLLPGFLPEPHSYVGHFDMLALSSLSEQQPIAVMEGMAAGLPIVSPPVGDVEQMVAPENAAFIRDGGAKALGAAIAELARDAGLRKSIGRANARKAADAFDESHMLNRYAALYGDALGLSVDALLG